MDNSSFIIIQFPPLVMWGLLLNTLVHVVIYLRDGLGLGPVISDGVDVCQYYVLVKGWKNVVLCQMPKYT